jgi:hypothetical protein
MVQIGYLFEFEVWSVAEIVNPKIPALKKRGQNQDSFSFWRPVILLHHKRPCSKGFRDIVRSHDRSPEWDSASSLMYCGWFRRIDSITELIGGGLGLRPPILGGCKIFCTLSGATKACVIQPEHSVRIRGAGLVVGATGRMRPGMDGDAGPERG